MLRIDPRLTKNFDYLLFFSTLIVAFIGITAIGSASWDQAGLFPWNNMAQHQMYWVLIGVLIALIVSFIDYEFFGRIAYILYVGTLILLVTVLVLGSSPTGARRWLKIAFLPAFQPSEFAKVTMIIVLSRYFASVRKDKLAFQDLLFPILLFTPVFFLVAKEPDLGTAASFFPIFVGIAYIAGFQLKKILGLGAAAIMAGIVLAPRLLKPYQLQRLQGFLNPEGDPLRSGYHIIQSKTAIGSGQLCDNWFFQGKLARLDFLPAAHTDFVFSVLAEDWGFIGASTVLFLFMVILYRGVRAARRSKDTLGALIVTGIVVSLTTHIFINIGMTLGILPITGLPLPLVSYGGSAILATFIQIGLLLNIGMRRLTFL